MSWTDKKSLEQIKKLRDTYNIKLFMETGTFKGINAAVHANNFEMIMTCEVNPEYYWNSKKKLFDYTNVFVALENSPSFLQRIKPLIKYTSTFIYLDAHFYDPSLLKEDRWNIMKELEVLRDTLCVIAIHDFDCNGLGHLTYDNQPLNFEFISNALYNINPSFYYYANTKEMCEPTTKEMILNNEIPNLILDEGTEDSIDFTWKSEIQTYRGILYCTPTELDLSKFELTKLEV